MSVFECSSVSSYLHKYINGLPRKGRGEASRIAAHLGVSSTLISQILSGEKVFTPEQTQMLIVYLGLSGVEADYVTFLVQYERAGNKELKKYWKSKLLELKEKSLRVINRVTTDRILTEQERSVFYSSPLFSAIRLYVSTSEKGRSIDEICERFDITRGRTIEIIRFLTETGFCLENNGMYSMGIQKTHVEQGSPHLLRHHTNWRIRAIQQIEELSAQELMYTAPVSLSQKDFETLREEMIQFIQSFLRRVHDSPPEEVACFNLDFFWIKK